MVKLNYTGPVEISPSSISIKFTDQVKNLHGYRQFQILPYIEGITTITENSVTWAFNEKGDKNPSVQVEFPSLKTFDICRTIPIGSLLSISIVNLMAIILLIIMQFIIIIGMCISKFRSGKAYGFVGNENIGYGSSH